MTHRGPYVPRPVGPRDVGENQRSMYALRRDGALPVNTWPPISGFYEKPWMVPDANGPRVKRWLPIRIWFAPSLDPETGLPGDRSAMWQCEIDGHPAQIEDAWPECSGRPVTENAYVELLASRDADDGYNPMEDSL